MCCTLVAKVGTMSQAEVLPDVTHVITMVISAVMIVKFVLLLAW
jgi:hypothetical protein